ncbi:MAG: Gfo/Idh/MocA family oxidoreductase [Actinomycetota bacterium]|nr:Gfo/Idh/MocA family oxidoreductase [Actinomycetota bacterium]
MTNHAEPVRWGVLGVADIAVRKVVPAVASSEVTSIEAIASRSGERARSAAHRLGVLRAHGSYEALLDDPAIEAVYIPLPNSMHAEWTIAAARAGKHVLCEKPLALSADEARHVADACEHAGVLLMEAFMYRLHPLWRTVLDIVRGGRIGDVLAAVTTFSYANDDPGDIRNQVPMGGGALYDIGCYGVSVARLVFDAEPDHVHATIGHDPVGGTDVVTSAVLDFGGRHGTIVCSTRVEDAQRVELLGTAGRLVVDIPFNIPTDRPTQVHVVAGGDPPVAPTVDTIEVPTADAYAIEVDALSRSIRTGAPVPIPPADSIANAAVIDRLVAGARTAPARLPSAAAG